MVDIDYRYNIRLKQGDLFNIRVCIYDYILTPNDKGTMVIRKDNEIVKTIDTEAIEDNAMFFKINIDTLEDKLYYDIIIKNENESIRIIQDRELIFNEDGVESMWS